MSLDTESLYRLLPAVHRLRDAGQGEPLRDLIGVIARELGVLEENLEQLYDDQFIETCADWVAPYIGQLVGYRPLHGVAPRVSSPRADVANTIRNRRRKGAASMLEQLARDVTDWPAQAVEYFEQLCATQYMKHLRPHALATARVESQRAILGRGGPFNRLSHTVEVRRPETRAGRFNIPNVGIWLWRLAPFRLTNVPLIADAGDASGRRFRLNPLGTDLALFRHVPEIDDVPVPLTIRELALQVRDAVATREEVGASRDYGANRSVAIVRANGDELPLRIASAAMPAGDADTALIVRIADLRDVVDGGGNVTGWAHDDDIAAHQVGIDPERGRVLLGADLAAEHASNAFTATFHYGFSRAMGGGEYERTPTEIEVAAPDAEAQGGVSLQAPLDALAPTGGRLLIGDSLTYAAPMIRLDGVTTPEAPGLTLVVGACNGARPLIDGAFADLDIGARGTLVLDGLVIRGALRLPAATDNEPRTLILRDCTLVPSDDASLVIEHPFSRVRLERCITGPLHVVAEANVGVELQDCIVDAGATDEVAFAANASGDAGASIALRECTIVGTVDARVIELASNCIFLGTVTASRRQEGCLRFCWLPVVSVTPRRFRCLPDAAHPDAQPHFTALRHGHPGYCQLRGVTAREIREGADDGGEMGVMHALFQPQRETNLRIRLDEYLRFGLRAGLFYAT
jgi:hypothetical protein